MLRWFQALMPREDKFFDLFTRHAEKLALASAALRRALDGGPDATRYAQEVSRFENEADAIAREVLLAVRRSFITPFDRSDISALTTALDDAVDQMQRTIKKIGLFDFRDFKPEMLQIADVAVEASDVVAKMVAMLPDMRDKNARIAALNVELKRLEEKSDELHDMGVTALYKAHRTDDPMAFIIGSEVYDNLEKVLDRLEDVGGRISDIVIENL